LKGLEKKDYKILSNEKLIESLSRDLMNMSGSMWRRNRPVRS